MKVYVYYNLHNNTFSVKALEGPQKGKVIAHRAEVWLKDVRPVVSLSGRHRVLREQRKCVHAGMVGEWIPPRGIRKGDKLDKVTYNPYKYDSFVYTADESQYTGSPVALLWQKQVWSIENA